MQILGLKNVESSAYAVFEKRIISYFKTFYIFCFS